MKNLLFQLKMLLSDLTIQDKKLIIMAFIALFCLLFSGCEVQAVISNEFISVDSTFEVVDRGLDFYNQLFRDFYDNSDIDISTFTGYYTFSTDLFSLNNKKAFFPCEENKFYVPVGLSSSGTINIAHTNPNFGFVRYYPTSSWNAYLIDFTNKSITVNSSAYSLTQMHQETLIDDVLSTGITTQEYYSSEYQEALLYEYCIYYNGPIKNSTKSTFLNEQEKNKKDFWDYTEDGVYSYWSGDIRLYDDYFEVKNFETNVSEYSMYLIRYSPTESIFGDYIIPNSYSYYEISKPNQGGTSTWQISNISDFPSGDAIYSIGIGTSDTPDLIRSDWFDADNNLSDFMNSNSFRLRYYVEDLPNFFLKKDVSGEYPSGDTGGVVVNPDGGDTDLTGGITGIWQALVNLPKTILDGLIGLFVPDAEYFYNDDLENPGLWQRFSVFMQGKLGFLWDVLVFIPNLISTIIDVITSFTENWSVTIPDLKVPTLTGVEEVVFLSSFEWSPYDWINQKVEFRNLYELYLDIIDFFVYWGLIWFFVDTVMTVFGNSDTVIDTTYNE